MFTWSIEKRVRAGMALLDKVAPDWHWRINVRSLDIYNRYSCVLGQVFGSYNIGCAKLGIPEDSNANLLDEVNNGFYSPTQLFQFAWPFSYLTKALGRRLTIAWKRAIIKRRAIERQRSKLESMSAPETVAV